MSILVAWFVERVPLLHPRILLEPSGPWEPRLMQLVDVLVWNDGGECGHYWMTTVMHVWQQIPHVILGYPYIGLDYRHDPNMTMPPWDDCDQRYVFVLCFMVLIANIWLYMCIWMFTLSLVFFCICGTSRLRGIDGRGSSSLGTNGTFACRDEGGREAETRWLLYWISTWAIGSGWRYDRGLASPLLSGVAGCTRVHVDPY
jgi:hypothetical protein